MTPELTADSPGDPSKQPPSTAGMTTKVVKGSIWTLAGQVAPLAVSLVTTPFVIRMLGAEGYGVYILIVLIPTYLAFADFGMAMTSTKFGSEAYGEGAEEKEGQVIRTAALTALLVSLPVASILFIFSSPLTGYFNPPEHLRGEASLALKIASITLVIAFLNNIFNSPQLARLRMDLNTMVSTVPRIAGLLVTPIVIYLGGGIVSAVCVLLAGAATSLIGNLLVSRHLLSTLFEFSLDKKLFRPMLKFGSALAISSVAAVLLVNLEKVVLTRATSVETLAYYSVAFTFASAGILGASAMTSSLIPGFSQLIASGNKSQLESLLSFCVRATFFAILPLVILLCVIAKPLFTIWAGPAFGDNSTVPLYILAVGVFFHANAFIGGSLLYASGRADVIAKFFWIQLLPYIAVTVVLTVRFGAVGAAIAWASRVILESAITCWLGARSAQVQFPFFQNAAVFAISIAFFVPAIIALSSVLVSSLWPLTLFAIGLIGYVVFVWRSGLSTSEREQIYGKFAVLRGRLS